MQDVKTAGNARNDVEVGCQSREECINIVNQNGGQRRSDENTFDRVKRIRAKTVEVDDEYSKDWSFLAFNMNNNNWGAPNDQSYRNTRQRLQDPGILQTYSNVMKYLHDGHEFHVHVVLFCRECVGRGDNRAG